MSRRLPVYIAFFAAMAVGAALSAGGAGAAPQIRPGAPAPAFAARDVDGRPVYLQNFAGKIIVLEWTNDACPFCGKHYDSGNMQALQRKYTGQGVVWLTIASSGYMTAAEARADLARWHAAPTDFLLDPGAAMAKLYDARATPNMVVIGRDGRIAYMGAIDDRPSTDPDDVRTAHNYVAAALNAVAAGQPVAVSAVPAYGCAIKYRGE
jgi:peroxiredoxin